jgi:iron complex outermembrane receptor protein
MMCGTPQNPVVFDAVRSQSWDDTSVKVSLSWAFNDNNNVYALYSEGYKAGGFQHDSRNLEAFNLFIEPETMKNYELGWKGQYDRARFAVTVFKMDQENSQAGNQIAIGSGNANMVFNVVGTDSEGIELEGTFAVSESFTVGGNVAFYNAEFKEGSLVGAAFNPISGAIEPAGGSIAGQRPDHSPDNTAALYAEYVFDLDGGSAIRLRGDWTHRSDAWARIANREGLNIAGTNNMNLRPALDKFGLQVDWTSADERLNLALWGRNLDDDADFLAPGPGTPWLFNKGQAGADGTRETSRPVGHTGRRVIGATVTYRFR